MGILEEEIDAVNFAAHKSKVLFEQWAALDHPVVPDNEVDSMQVLLARWQQDRFGHLPTSDLHFALGVIEELGEAYNATRTQTDPVDALEEAFDALGDVMVYSAQLCTRNRLAIRPVIELATFIHRNYVVANPVTLAGDVAHTCLKHAQGIRGFGDPGVYRMSLVGVLSAAIASTMDRCVDVLPEPDESGEGYLVDPIRVFVDVGGVVLKRKKGDVMIPNQEAVS